VTTKNDPKLGMILADGSGLTLYTLTNNGKAVDCTGACAAVWPPLVASSGGAPTPGSGVGTLGVASLSDGIQVVTTTGLPLYRFSQDHDSGDAYGEGISSFGGVWHVVRAGQVAAATAPAVTVPPTTAKAVAATPAPTMPPAPAPTRPSPANTTPMTHSGPAPTMHQTPATTPGGGTGWRY
jgi:predicted lipoprotein with Yx(FWY)xxD motif